MPRCYAVSFVEYVWRDFVLVDVLGAGVTKGTTLAEWARAMGFPRTAIMAVGDNHNDREMLEFAGVGVAMGNSVAELLDGAFHVTGTNDEAGLAQAIDRFVLAGRSPGLKSRRYQSVRLGGVLRTRVDDLPVEYRGLDDGIHDPGVRREDIRRENHHVSQHVASQRPFALLVERRPRRAGVYASSAWTARCVPPRASRSSGRPSVVVRVTAVWMPGRGSSVTTGQSLPNASRPPRAAMEACAIRVTRGAYRCSPSTRSSGSASACRGTAAATR